MATSSKTRQYQHEQMSPGCNTKFGQTLQHLNTDEVEAQQGMIEILTLVRADLGRVCMGQMN